MANLKEVRIRIQSVNTTMQITSAMKLVSASKLRKAQDNIVKLRPYAKKLREIIQRVSGGNENLASGPLFQKNNKSSKVLFIVFTSNRGLCGVFNANIVKQVQILSNELKEKSSLPLSIEVVAFGKKGHEMLSKRGFNVVQEHNLLIDKPNYDQVSQLANSFIQQYSHKEYDSIYLIYNQFKNAATQMAISESYLPFDVASVSSSNASATDYLVEPDADELFELLVPKVLKIQLYKALLDSIASEHGARMTAMHKATDNATELLKQLKLLYNKERQASITKEILEIVGGAEALKS